MEDTLSWLQQWYSQQTNGDWEHCHGVAIDTLDNPGWKVTIDLAETAWAGRALDPIEIDRTEVDWIRCTVVNSRYQAFGGPLNLKEILEVFRNWVQG